MTFEKLLQSTSELLLLVVVYKEHEKFNRFMEKCPTVKSFKVLELDDDVQPIKKKLQPILYDFFAFICFHLDAIFFLNPNKTLRNMTVWRAINQHINDVKELPKEIDLFLKNKENSKYKIAGPDLSYTGTYLDLHGAYYFLGIRRTPVKNLLSRISNSNIPENHIDIPADHNIILKIDLPKNTEVIEFPTFVLSEHELLLPRGSMFELKTIKKLNNVL